MKISRSTLIRGLAAAALTLAAGWGPSLAAEESARTGQVVTI